MKKSIKKTVVYTINGNSCERWYVQSTQLIEKIGDKYTFSDKAGILTLTKRENPKLHEYVKYINKSKVYQSRTECIHAIKMHKYPIGGISNGKSKM